MQKAHGDGGCQAAHADTMALGMKTWDLKHVTCNDDCRRGFERLLRKLLRLKNMPAVLVVHWWAPLHFLSSYWNVAEDELDVIASYYRLPVRPPSTDCTLLR